MIYIFTLLYCLFIKDPPVLMAGNPFRNTTAAYAMAALPIVSVPIQEVQLFDYAVAHKSVNSSYGLTANASDTYVIGKDPYTSDQQRSRDQYEINDNDWNEVTFEQVLGSSKCKLALHNDWISQNSYSVDAIVNMNLPEQDDRLVSDEGRKSSDTKSLDRKVTESNWISASTNAYKIGWNVGDIQYLNMPEQGISGPFLITSIKHITPQKKPVDEDSADDFEYRPVTGLFVHESNDVWKITFDDGTQLGVTNNHPIFSVSKGDWQHAGHLEIGEEVLAKSGNTKVVSKERDLTVQPVYNLEIKDLHNFLVGDVGVVVHNNCFEEFRKLMDGLIENVDGKLELGWYTGETMYLSINSILKKTGTQSGATMKKLTEVAEEIAKKSGLKEVRIDFELVVNTRLANDATWAAEYGYHFSKHIDQLGSVVVTWEKVLD